MQYPPPGHHRDVESFRARLRSLDAAFDVDAKVEGAAGPLGREIVVAGRRLANRFAVQPMEGWDGGRDGLPSAHTLRRWRNFGASGADLVWGGEAFAVEEGGRANPRQLFLNDRADALGGLVRLREEVERGRRESTGGRGDELLLGLQLTHSGRFAQPDGPRRPRVAFRHPLLDRRFGVDASVAPLTDGELEAIGERFVAAARLAWRAGFRFVDVKCCHGYLLHELLSARARPGSYGGDFDGRTRLFRRIVAAIRAACPQLAIGVRVSLADVFPHAADPETGVGAPLQLRQHTPYTHGFGVDADDPLRFDLDEPLRFLSLLHSLDVRLVNVSLGSPYYSPHLQRPAAFPPSDGYLPPEDPLRSVLRHLEAVRRAKAAFPDLIVVGSGYSYLQEWLPNVAQYELRAGHVDFVGLGRMMLAWPELPREVLLGRPLARARICRTFSDCTSSARAGFVSGCYPLDPYYRALAGWRAHQGTERRRA